MCKKIKTNVIKEWILKIIFWLLITASFFMALNSYEKYKYQFGITGFGTSLKPVTINLTFIKPASNDVFFCFGDYCKRPQNLSFKNKNNLSNVYSIQYNNFDGKFFTVIKNIKLLYPDDEKFIKNIERIDIYIDDDRYHYYQKDILKSEKKTVSIDNSGITGNKNKTQYGIKNFNIKDNVKNKPLRYSIIFLSFFYHWEVFIIPYVMLFMAFLIFIFNKNIFFPKFKNINYKWYLGIIILSGMCLRIAFINYRSLWLDEIYTKEIAIKSFIHCFLDSGNPPLFFLLEFFVKKLGFTSDFSLRFLPFVFGILFIYIVFLIFKKIDKNLALTAAFFASINLILIMVSSAARSFSFDIFMGAFSLYYLFKYLDNPKTKNLAVYFLTGVCLINSHYICAIFVFSNLVWGIFKLLKNNKKEIIKFSAVNLIAYLTFIPYLLLNTKTALSPAFNSWISPISKKVIVDNLINQFFINKYIFLFILLLTLVTFVLSVLPEKIRKKCSIDESKRELFVYLIYSIISTALIVSLISFLIKPIFTYRVILASYQLFFLAEIILIFTIFKKTDFKPLIFIKSFYSLILGAVILCATNMPFEIPATHRLDDYIDFIKIDMKKYPDYSIFAAVNDTKEYLNYYSDKPKNINWNFINTNQGRAVADINREDIYKEIKMVVYFHHISANIENLEKNKNALIYNTNYGKMGKVVFD